MCSCRSLLALLALLAMSAAATARPPAPPRPHMPKPPKFPVVKPPKFPVVKPPRLPVVKPPRLPVVRPPHPPIRRPPVRVTRTKVIRYPRPIVHRGPIRHVGRPGFGVVRHPVRRAGFRTVHRYPIHRFPRRFVRRPYYFGARRYSYSYFPGRYRWRSNRYHRGYGIWRQRVVGGVVESVQGVPGNGILLVRVSRRGYGRFRYGAAGRGATSLRRFHLNIGTLYEIRTIPPRLGTVADLRRGERVLIQTLSHTANTAQKVMVVSLPRRR